MTEKIIDAFTNNSDIFIREEKDVNDNKEDIPIFFPLKKIISGGQTGADMGGLLAAQHLRIKTSGTVPFGYFRSKKKIDDLKNIFNLEEIPITRNTNFLVSKMYIERSKINVDNSDGTVAFRTHSSPGTDKTIGYCITKKWKYPSEKIIIRGDLKTFYKPILVITDLISDQNLEMFNSWIIKYNIKTMNICGHREENFTNEVKNFLIKALEDKFPLKNFDK